jgi:hypothetical protein
VARIPNRTLAHCGLALAALVLGLEPLLPRSLGSHAPSWSHWWCSASSLHASASSTSAALTATRAGGNGWLGGALHTTLALLAVHWPHFLPILLALGTFVYLWRANETWRSQAPGPASARTSRTSSA